MAIAINSTQPSPNHGVVWNNGTIVCPVIPSAEDYGWKLNGDEWTPIMTTELPAPKAVLHLVKCGCKTQCHSDRCSCRQAPPTGLDCTELCGCTDQEQPCENVALDSDEDWGRRWRWRWKEGWIRQGGWKAFCYIVHFNCICLYTVSRKKETITILFLWYLLINLGDFDEVWYTVCTINWLQNDVNVSNLTWTVSLHYLVKVEMLIADMLS